MVRQRLAIIVFDEVEVLDFAGPFEVFSALRLDESTRRESVSPYDVVVVSTKPGIVNARGGLRIVPNCHIDELHLDDLHTLLIPGGYGTRALLKDAAFIDWLRDAGSKVQRLVSVCTGSLLLAEAGHLNSKQATTHWASLDWMQRDWPQVHVQREKHYVFDGRLASSAGISAGIDLSLKIIEIDHGETLARATANYMEYPYPENDQRRM
jgi:transcriptional regulator GlxA family with amidase domain